MTDKEIKLELTGDSASVQTHLSILQNVIQRMASNSASCKTWCVTLVSAILVLIAGNGKSEYAWISLLPAFSFAFLDAYYLALEKGFRNSYNEFVTRLHQGTLTELDMYSVSPEGGISKMQLMAFKSFSVWGFYSWIIALIVIIENKSF